MLFPTFLLFPIECFLYTLSPSPRDKLEFRSNITKMSGVANLREIKTKFTSEFLRSKAVTMSVNDKIAIIWLTEDDWKGKQHSTKRKLIDPGSPEPLVSGQRVCIKFNCQWFPALVVTPWSRQKNANTQPEQTKGVQSVLFI